MFAVIKISCIFVSAIKQITKKYEYFKNYKRDKNRKP
jgi:hypothetical protein